MRFISVKRIATVIFFVCYIYSLQTSKYTGEEPRISKYNVSSVANQAAASVFCRPCSKERFNDRFNISSASYSECPSVKTNLCTELAHKLDCGYISYKELTKTDGYCRCDARNGNKSEKSTSASITTQSSSHDDAFIMTTTAHGPTGTPLFRKAIEEKNAIVFIMALIILILITVLVITVYWVIQDKGRCCYGRKESFQKETDAATREEIPLIELPTGETRTLEETATRTEMKYNTKEKVLKFATTHLEPTEPSTSTCSGTVLLKLDDTKTDSSEPIITGADLTNYKPEYYPGQQTVQTVIKHIEEKGFKWKTCLEIIKNDTDFRKLDGFEIGQNDCYFTKVCTRIDVPGYQAYEIPGNETASIYEILSVLLCGNRHMEEIIRLAVARSALINYSKNGKKLVDMFKKTTNAVKEAITFFNAYGIEYKETTLKRDVENSYFELVREIIVEGKRKGPFHVELLGEVLNCNIKQHVEDGCFDGKGEQMLPGLNIGLHSREPIDRELCVYWLWSGVHDSGQYIIIPLFKNANKDEDFAIDCEPFSTKHIQKQFQDIIDTISKQSSFSGRECLKMIKDGVSWDFDSLKTVHICKPKETMGSNTAIAPGYTAYEKPGNEPVCLYEWISHMYDGTDRMKFVVRLAAARFAMEHFKKCSKELCTAFNTSDTPAADAEIFFELHGIEYQNNQDLKKDVRIALAALVRDTVTAEKGNGPLFADFLFGALNYQLTRHFENNRYQGQDVGKIPALNVTLTSKAPSGREVHLFWRESRSDTPDTYRILRLIKDKGPNNH